MLRFESAPRASHFGAVEVRGLPVEALARLAQRRLEPADWQSILVVRKAVAGTPDDPWPAVLGAYGVDGDTLRFTPRFELAAGIAFRARFDGERFDRLTGGPGATAAATPSREITFTPPAPPAAAATVVEAVFPSGPVVPANLLRVYLHFSAPMRARDVAGAVRLIDAAGGEVELPFVEIEHGLWDRGDRRLTLFFHPGRLKRGVGPHLALGTPLREGGTYRLVVDAALRDALGRPLGERFEHAFRAGPPDRESPDPTAWTLRPPRGPAEPLTVEFPEPLDRALVLRLLAVRDAAGAEVPGRATLAHHETRWSFRPERPWVPGRYVLAVHPALEDLAGNRLDRLFDEETAGDGDPGRRSGGVVELGFTAPG